MMYALEHEALPGKMWRVSLIIENSQRCRPLWTQVAKEGDMLAVPDEYVTAFNNVGYEYEVGL